VPKIVPYTSTSTIEVTRSDKPDNKLSNKPATDGDLTFLVEKTLSPAIRSAILTLVRASRGE